jgi:hypothetical protein
MPSDEREEERGDRGAESSGYPPGDPARASHRERKRSERLRLRPPRPGEEVEREHPDRRAEKRGNRLEPDVAQEHERAERA